MTSKFFDFKLTIGLLFLWVSVLSCERGNADIDVDLQSGTPTEESRALSEEDAVGVAETFLMNRYGTSSKSGSRTGQQEVRIISGTDKQPVAYVINNSGGGWVIVSATKDYYPILAYSDGEQGKFDLDVSRDNEGLSLWIEEVSKAIESSEDLDSVTASHIALEWLSYTPQLQGETLPWAPPGGYSPQAVKCRERMKVLNDTYYKDGWSFYTLPNVTQVTLPQSVYDIADSHGSPREYVIVGIRKVSTNLSVGPLLTTKWGQQNEFNASCPGTPAGCVTIAMAQIMNYHRFPARFDWDGMLDDVATVASQYLIRDIRDALGMKLTEYESNIDKALSALIAYGYRAEKKGHNDSDVEREIVVFKRPIYMRGIDSVKGGHAWICDGVIRNTAEYQYYAEYLNSVLEYTNYGETFLENPGGCGWSSNIQFHMNWGWYGNNDGWYVVPTPDMYDFTYGRQNLYVHPN